MEKSITNPFSIIHDYINAKFLRSRTTTYFFLSNKKKKHLKCVVRISMNILILDLASNFTVVSILNPFRTYVIMNIGDVQG